MIPNNQPIYLLVFPLSPSILSQKKVVHSAKDKVKF